jgi:diguanylate cyclase (GGDEF)-like protein/PAS domain S-box-containing protein
VLNVLGCFVDAHDLRLVALAAGVCALASVTAVWLLCHAARTPGRTRYAWLAVAAVAGGSGIWATHFIAMLAFSPNIPAAYAVGRTVLSLVHAVLLTGIGLLVALWPGPRVLRGLGGAIAGGGIAAMHYTGMAAYEVAGHIRWDAALVAASIALGAAFGGAAVTVALSGPGLRPRVAGALLLIVAICGHHFTAMGAVTIVPDPAVEIPAGAIPSEWLAVAVALASLAILLLACAALALDLRDRRLSAQEGERLRSLANAAVEGLVVCRGDRIVSANDSFAALAGSPTADLVGLALSSFLPGDATRLALAAQPDQPVEADLRRANGETVPVELILRPVEYANQPHYAVAVRDLRARRRAERQIQFLAHHDPLTGLANRASFHGRLDQEIRLVGAGGRKLAVLCLDLDRFKEVNDLFGHAAGDAMLVGVARVAGGLLAEGQMMARLGGDEFAILASFEHAVGAGRLAEALLEALRQRNLDAPGGPLVATSIGIAIYPDDATDRTVLLSYADTALYRAKSEGRGTYRFFEAAMGVEVRERRMLEHGLRHAIARGEMRMVYQPQCLVAGGEVTGFEALLRWRRPGQGSVSPAVFIPIAEESGLILQIGEWVLREVCREAAGWPRALAVAVNVSAVQIHHPGFVQTLHDILMETRLDPARLEIELTETALIRDPGRALATLQQIKRLGVGIAMDDFGTGYSSLSNLRAFPFDKIKIDASFIRSVDRNSQTAAIVRSVLGLGRGLDLPVLAEGVETEQELSFLEAEGCQGVQGYLIGRPAAITAFHDHTHGTPAGEGAAVRAA